MNEPKSTWNEFNDLKHLAMTVQSDVERKDLNAKLSYMQTTAERNYSIAQSKSSDLRALEGLRSNEKYLTDKMLGIEESRRQTRTWFIVLLVIVNAVQMVLIINNLAGK